MVRSTELGSKLVVFCAAMKLARKEVNRMEVSMVAVAMEGGRMEAFGRR